jgi:hypothetical protein
MALTRRPTNFNPTDVHILLTILSIPSLVNEERYFAT